MITVFPSKEVAHVWAHQKQQTGRNGASNFGFQGPDLYSWSTVIGRIVTNKRGTAVLLATRNYSSPTCKHQCKARSAVSHMTVFCVNEIEGGRTHTPFTPRGAFEDYKAQLLDLIGKWRRARDGKPFYLEQIQKLTLEANAFAEFFGLRGRIKGDPKDIDAMVAESKRIDEANQRKRRVEDKKRAAARLLQEQQDEAKRQAWIEGKTNYFPHEYDTPIRLRIKGDDLETSKGAFVPLKHAIRLFKIIQKVRKFNEPYQRNGHTEHVGRYDVDAIDSDGNITVGCHRVEWPEVERVAKLAGLL